MESLRGPSRANVPDLLPAAASGVDFRVIDSVELLNGARELRIRHGVNTYRLRVTASDKLILTK